MPIPLLNRGPAVEDLRTCQQDAERLRGKLRGLVLALLGMGYASQLFRYYVTLSVVPVTSPLESSYRFGYDHQKVTYLLESLHTEELLKVVEELLCHPYPNSFHCNKPLTHDRKRTYPGFSPIPKP